MGNSAFDVVAFGTGVVVAALITATLFVALRRDDHRRGWQAAGGLVLVLLALGALDLARATPRETPFAVLLFGIVPPVLGALGLLRGTRRLKPWLRTGLAFVVAFVLLYAGFLFGAVIARWLPF
jgi:hypothetical protein